MYPRLTSITIRGYRPFRELVAPLGPLEVLVGANGTGKSSLFEFLRFLRDSVEKDIPPEIVEGNVGIQLFHQPGPQRLGWALQLAGEGETTSYEGELMGPVGSARMIDERAVVLSAKPEVLLERGEKNASVWDEPYDPEEQLIFRPWFPRPNQLALNIATGPHYPRLYLLREHIRSWRFYGAFALAKEKMRQLAFIEQEPVLREDGGNLSSVLHYLLTEQRPAFDELQQHLRSIIPGFRGLSVKARGGPGQVMAFWQEEGVDEDLSLADLSDGTLHLLCWITLCVHPHPPDLICIDEPDQGVHPRTLPLLAGLFQKAADRTQILLATHASYFLLQFDLAQIAVLRKEGGEVRFYKPGNSAALAETLADFGPEEIEALHRSDELEQLA
ncbi:MAG TPA: AAA family ATPase [Thermoanaerobaculia bacterium]|nr:AAA family ATPase [Thermoanaerobaculia bacterium]